MRRWLLAASVVFGACGSPDSPHLTGDAAPMYSYSITVGAPAVDANPRAPRTVTVTGTPGDSVVVTLDRTSAGSIATTSATIDATGTATLPFTPCTAALPDCTGGATLSLSLASAPTTHVADQAITLVASADVGDVTACQTSANVVSIDGPLVVGGTYTSAPQDDWTVEVQPDQIHLAVGTVTNLYQGRFSLLELAQPIAPGIYEHAQRAAFVEGGHPGIEVLAPGRGCNKVDGRFKVHDYTADAATGAVHSVTISFELVCEYTPDQPQADQLFTTGCFHYQTTPPTPPTPPAPDPTKVSVEVRSNAIDRAPDPTAIAIFTDTNGTVVLDTQVNSFGQAEVSLPTGGSLTVIQIDSNNREYLTTYRGVHNGDHLVVNRMLPTSGVEDLMLVTLTPPPNNNGFVLTSSCGTGPAIDQPADPLSMVRRAQLSFHDGCRPSTFELLSTVAFVDGSKQYVWQTGLTHTPNGNAVVPSTWAPMGTATVTLTNVPANPPALRTSWSTRVGTQTQLIDEAIGTPTATTDVRSLMYPPGAGTATVLTVDKPGFLVLATDQWTLVDTTAPSSVTLDITSQPVPLLSAFQQTQTGASWTQSSGGTADVLRFNWRAETPTRRAMWTVLEPYTGQASVVLPTLPAARASLDPTVGAGVQTKGAFVILSDYDVGGFTLDSPPAGSYRMHESIIQNVAATQPF